jgi:hypothetical protein
MFVFGLICAVLSIANGVAAVYFAMHERLAIASLLLINFATMGFLVVLGVFG